MLKEKSRLEAKIAEIDEQIRKLPLGKFVCCHAKNCTKWYCSDGHKKKYIKKEERDLAGKLLYKKYLTFLLEELTHEKQAVESYLDQHKEEIPKSSQLMAESPEFQKLLKPFQNSIRKELEEWMNVPYEKNPFRPQDLKVKTPSGEYVRSKSEAFIYSCLMKYNIPFRYEFRLIVGDKVIYPDFTIRHPKTGEYFYFEHCGRMDKPKYAYDSFDRLGIYYKIGVIPGINLITTYENEANPLSMELVEKIIQYYFCD